MGASSTKEGLAQKMTAQGISFNSTFQNQKQKLSLVSILTSITLGVGAALIGLNYYHASSCIPNSPDEKEAHINAIGSRLHQVERQISQNTATMEKLLASVQSHSLSLSTSDYSALVQASQSEAIKIALEMVAYPAPIMPDSVRYKYDASSSSSSESGEEQHKWGDDQFSLLGKDSSSSSKGGESGAGSYSSKFDDLYSTGGLGAGSAGSANGGKSSTYTTTAGKQDQTWETLTDAQSTSLCSEMREKYSVVPGVSWGSLPYDLQQRWIHYSCDLHLTSSS